MQRQTLLTAINELAPNGKVQRAFVKRLHELESSGYSDRVVTTVLVGLLYDGLAYGNWIGDVAEPNKC